MTQDVTTFDNAFERLANGLLTNQKVQVGSFKDFLVNVWSQSFDNPVSVLLALLRPLRQPCARR